jgi:polysaccharide pyruvyl transferase WcaK-like protein
MPSAILDPSSQSPLSDHLVRGDKAPRKGKGLRVGLLSPSSSRNLGDTAIQMTVIQNLRARMPTIEIVGIYPDPNDTVCSLGIGGFPLDGCGPAARLIDPDEVIPIAGEIDHGGEKGRGRWRALKRIAAFVGSLDLLIVSGGGQLDDFWGGPWGHPFTVFTWVALARLYGVKIAFMGVGSDRLSNRLSRFFVLSALRLAHYRSFRDKGTLVALEGLGLHAPSHLCPDLAFGLQVNGAVNFPHLETEPFVAVNPISVETWVKDRTDDRHKLYLQHLAGACDWIAGRGLRVHIVCSQSTMDRPFAVRLNELIQPRFSSRMKLCDAPRVGDFLAQVHGAHIVIASRLHGAILSLVTGVPVVAISPLRKVTQLMNDVGLADYTLELQNFTPADLIDRVQAALDQRPGLQRQITERVQTFYMSLARTYDEVLALV